MESGSHVPFTTYGILTLKVLKTTLMPRSFTYIKMSAILSTRRYHGSELSWRTDVYLTCIWALYKFDFKKTSPVHFSTLHFLNYYFTNCWHRQHLSLFHAIYRTRKANPRICVPRLVPHLVKDITALEKLQRRASRLALRQSKGEMPYEDRCKLLKWPTLSTRRDYLTLIECYKIVFGLGILDFHDFFEFTKVRSTRANHSFKLYVKAARINCYKFSFFVRVVKMWNNLPKDIVEADGFRSFKQKLKVHLGV